MINNAHWTLTPPLAACPLLIQAETVNGAVDRQPLNIQAIILFVLFVAATLYITYWASKRTRSRKRLLQRLRQYCRAAKRPGHLRRFYVRRVVPRHFGAGVYVRL